MSNIHLSKINLNLLLALDALLSEVNVIHAGIKIEDINAIDKNINLFEGLGYNHMGEYGITGRRYFWKHDEHVDYHLQCFQYDHPGSVNTILLRDYLIQPPDIAAQYAQQKIFASNKHPQDTHEYWREKSEFAERILAEAKKQFSGGKK